MQKSKPRSSGASTKKGYAKGTNTKAKGQRISKKAQRAKDRRTALKKVADDVCDYLRVRRYIDGVYVNMNKPYEYKSKDFKALFFLMGHINQGNYFGVSFTGRDGIVNDTIFTDFFIDYMSQPKDYWRSKPSNLKKLIFKYTQVYFRRGKRGDGGHLDEGYYREVMQGHQLDARYEYQKLKDNDFDFSTADKDETIDYLFKSQRDLYRRMFTWEKMSRKKSKRKKRKEAETNKSRTWQSIRAFDALTNKNNVTLDDRFILLCSGARKEVEHKAALLLVDKQLQFEHHFILSASNNINKENSVFKGINELLDYIEYFGNVNFKTGELNMPVLPTIADNLEADAHIAPQVLNFEDGGYVAGGCPHDDSSLCNLMYGEFVITTKAVRAIGKGSQVAGAKILSNVMRFFESQEHKYR